MFVRIFSIVVAVPAIVFGLIGTPTFLYADLEAGGEVNVSALVPTEEEEPEMPETPSSAGPVFVPDTTPPEIFDIVVDNITSESATISWKTSEPAIPQINYGKTKDYEKTIIGKDFLTSYRIVLKNLLAETVYHFEIVVADWAGNRTSSGDSTFKTLLPPDITPPANVINFEAIGGDRQITLKWKNPPGLDFSGVRIMRSETFYPSDPLAGELVYSGKDTSFIDTGLENGLRYYYTAFAYDEAGNYSSGALASAIPYPPEIPIPPIPPIPPPPPPPVPPLPPDIEKLTLEDFDFIQEGKKILPKDGKILIDPEKPLTVSLVYEKVPEVLKTLMLTLQKEKEEKFFSFILRINQEKTAYLGTIMAPEAGIYPLILSILDYKNQNLKKITGELRVLEVIPELPLPWYKRYPLWKFIIYVLLVLLALLVIIYLLKKAREKSRKKNESKRIYKQINTNHEL